MQPINYVEVPHQLNCGDSVFPSVVVNDGSLTTQQECADWIKFNSSELEAKLRTSGAILFRGFPVNSAETFDEFSNSFGYPNFTYKESLSNAVRINFTERVFTANEAPKDVEIFLHHEMAQTPISPSKLFFFCKSAAEKGGETPLCRSDMLFEDLAKQMPSLAADFVSKGLKYTTQMPAEDDPNSGQGRSWKSTLSVQDDVEAEQKLTLLGYSWEWLADGSWKGVRENPSSAITFGDGADIPLEGLQLAVKLSEKYTFDLPWQDGDVALVDNYMTMHGRRPFLGERKRQVLVSLAID
jgi:alpha-ketoglutarate-dependent taurine dioxygenase